MLRGRLVSSTEVIEDGVVLWDNDTIGYAGSAATVPPQWRENVADSHPSPDRLLLPGLVDVHCHGGGGASFPDSEDATTARKAAAEHLDHGTTSLVASLVTQTPQILMDRVRVLTELVASGDLVGIHLEGPFLSVDRCGAQDPEIIQVPDPELVREIVALAGGALVTMTLAPELAGNTGAGSVSQALIDGGALPSFGHTDASAGEMRRGLAEAFEWLTNPQTRSRRPTVTHLFNGMRPLQHREAGPIPDALAAARLGTAVVELIGDGTHVSPALVQEVFELVGRENVILVTDAMAATGMPDGSYRLGSMSVTVDNGVARIADGSAEGGSLAGGTAHLLDVVRTTVAGGVPLVDAVFAATAGPTEVLGRDDIGVLEAGRRADVLVTDQNLRPVEVWRRGVRVR